MHKHVVLLWLSQIRAPFLLLPVVLMAISGALAYQVQSFHLTRFLLALVGVMLAHIAVNLLNEYSDYQTGIDARTRRTPFSGGSGNLQHGLTSPNQVRLAALIALLLALMIGLYLSWQTDWRLVLFVLPGGLIVLLYTNWLTKLALGELAAGLGLGSLVIMGGYYALTGTLTAQVILLSLPPGLLTACLLLLNEFPDAAADQAGGRRHLVILLGHRQAAVIYLLALILCYAIIVLGAVLAVFPIWVLLALLTLPLAVKAGLTALRHGRHFEKMIPAQGANVAVVIGTDLLLAIGYLI